jgi:hypothetical protein
MMADKQWGLGKRLHDKGYQKLQIWLTPERAAELEALAAARKQTPTLVATEVLVNWIRWRHKDKRSPETKAKAEDKKKKLALTDSVLEQFLK